MNKIFLLGLVILCVAFAANAFDDYRTWRSVKECRNVGAVKAIILEDGRVVCFFEDPRLTATGGIAPLANDEGMSLPHN